METPSSKMNNLAGTQKRSPRVERDRPRFNNYYRSQSPNTRTRFRESSNTYRHSRHTGIPMLSEYGQDDNVSPLHSPKRRMQTIHTHGQIDAQQYNYNEDRPGHRYLLDQTHSNITDGNRHEIPNTDRVSMGRRHSRNPESHTGRYRIPRRQLQYRRGARMGQRGDVRSSHVNFKKTHQIELKNMYSALEKKDPSEVALTLGTDIGKFKLMLNRCKNNIKETFSSLKVLARGFQSNSTPEILANIISILKEKEFIMSALELVLSELTTSTKDAKDTKDNKCCGRAVVDILKILLRIFEMKPSELVFLNGIYKRITALFPVLVGCLDDDVIIKPRIEVEDTLKENNACSVYENNRISAFFDNREFSEVKRLFSEFEFCVKTSLERNKKRETMDETNFEKDVPNDNFRNISVYPTYDDLMLVDNLQLRQNRINGKYANATEYLDIHFRLMREDFIAPLRNGIRQASTSISSKKSKEFQDVKIYEHVRIMSVICEDGINHVLNFDTSKLQHINWHTSKRLKYGSLLVLSADNFNTCFFATITRSDVQIKRRGRIYVKFNKSIEEMKTHDRSVFTMAESNAFFETYRPVATALQRIRETKFPFYRYILFCEKEVLPPKYLRKNTDCQFDLLPLHDNTMTIGAVSFLKEPGKLIIPFKLYDTDGVSDTLQSVKLLGQKWPSADDLHMDESQLRAIKMALTKEFSIIQGPPGCGKTYIGLAIVKALLHNKTAWQSKSGRRAQLMIVCYTNHALDQFMEGICNFYDGDIVRIGNRSSSEALQTHNLKGIRHRIRDSRQVKSCIHFWMRSTVHKMNDIKMRIFKNAMFIEVIKENIVKEEYIRREIGRFYKQFEWYRRRMSNLPSLLSYLGESVLVRWLRIDDMAKSIQNDIQDSFNKYSRNEPFDVLQNQDEQQKYDEYNCCDRKITTSQKKELESFKKEIIALNISNLNDTIIPSMIRDVKMKLALKIQNLLASTEYLSDTELDAVDDILSPEFTTDKRWRLYLKWVHDKCSTLEEEDDIATAMEDYENKNNIKMDINNQETKYILQRADVIGLTTTRAANMQTLLQEIKPKIIIVEEAAEIFESHIISCISSGCEQLIMIGDHQQLRPKPNVYKMETEYNLHISLFERMIRNGLHCECLQIQHRMRPEISSNIKNMYPYLQDHSNVLQYEAIKGIRHSLFFISHKFPESKNDELSSYTNLHEANFILALCQYIILQGYKSTEITVLTTYKGQMYAIQKNIRERYPGLDNVQVTIVDDYQGEENEIILLSLVRSNSNNATGYVAMENRICVALSRARKGLYVIGNFEAFSKTEPWGKIVSQMKQKGFLGENLLLKCQNHIEDEGILVQTADDFEQVSEGGCGRQCDARLNCGHVCPKKCHTIGKEHKDIICEKPCTKQCVRGHKCHKMCHQQCYCSKVITQKLEKCGHKVEVQCSKLTAYFQCNTACGKLLSCGHICQKKCYKSCEPCEVSVQILRPDCGHLEMRKCSKVTDISLCTKTCGLELDCGHSCPSICGDLQCQIVSWKKYNSCHKSQSLCPRDHSVLCNVKCEASLTCGHTCTGTCSTCFQGRWHIDCETNCQCILVCGHSCTGKCNNCKPCKESCRRQCLHRGCWMKCSNVCYTCTEICGWKCIHLSCELSCGEPCERSRCNEPCQKKLRCNHDCIGLCGDTCPTLCRICNKRALAKLKADSDSRFVQLQDCGDIVEVEAMDKYMDIDEGARLKVCPVCHAPIYSTNGNRYEGVVNRIIRKMNSIKRNVLQSKYIETYLTNQLQKTLVETHNIYDRINWCIDQINARNITLKLISLRNEHEYSGCWRSIDTVLPPEDRSKITPHRAMETEREILRYFDSCMAQEMLDMLKLTNVTDENILKNANLLKELLNNKGSYDDNKRKQVKEQLTKIYKCDISSLFVNVRIQFRHENFEETIDGIEQTTDGIVEITDGIVETTDGIVETTDGIVASTDGIVASTDGIVETTDGILTSANDIVETTDCIVASTDGNDGIAETTHCTAAITDGTLATSAGIAATTDDCSAITLMVWSGAGYFKCSTEHLHTAPPKRKHEENCTSIAPLPKIRKLEHTRVDSQRTIEFSLTDVDNRGSRECSRVAIGSRRRIDCTHVARDSRKSTGCIEGVNESRGSKRQLKKADDIEKSKTPTVVKGNALTLQRPVIISCKDTTNKQITNMDGTGKNKNGTRKCHDSSKQNSRDTNYNKLNSLDESNGSESVFDTIANIDIVASITDGVPNKSISCKEQITVNKHSSLVCSQLTSKVDSCKLDIRNESCLERVISNKPRTTRECQLKCDDLRYLITQKRASQSQQVQNNNPNTTDLLETFRNQTDVTRSLRKRRSDNQNDSKAGDLRKVNMTKRVKNENDSDNIVQKSKLYDIYTKLETVKEVQTPASKSINASSKCLESIFTTDGNVNPHAHHIRDIVEPPGVRTSKIALNDTDWIVIDETN